MTKYIFKKLVKEVGYYCSIVIDCQITKDNNFYLEIKDKTAESWKEEIGFAVKFFYYKLKKTINGGLNVIIVDIDTNTIDTSSSIVFYTVVKALILHFQLDIKGFDFDEDGSFKLPK